MKNIKRIEQLEKLEFDLWKTKTFERDLTEFELSQYNRIKKLRIQFTKR
jgi:hypothetical protein